MSDHISPVILRGLIAYEPKNGKLFWMSRRAEQFKDNSKAHCKIWNSRFAGREAFTANNGKGYFHGSIFGRLYKAHRVAWAIYYGKWPRDQIDHINGDPSDNRISNLRSVTNLVNSRNRKVRHDNKTGHTGIAWRESFGRWTATGMVDGQRKHLGCFTSIEDAILARSEFCRENGFTERGSS